MAKDRYYCKNCDYLVEYDSRRKNNILCPICSADLRFSWFHGGVAERKLYGSCDYGVRTYSVPEGVERIDDGFFAFRSSLESVILPSTLVSIPPRCFEDCKGLKSITIPNSVKSIGSAAFENCSGLTSIELPDSITEISANAFRGCTGLKRVDLPVHLKEIGDSAFANCENLVSIFLPDSLERIGNSAFWGCKNITAIVFGSKVKTIGGRAFSLCFFQRAYLPKSVEYAAEDWISWATVATDCTYGAAVADHIIIAEGTQTIPPHAFDSTEIKSVSFPDSVTEIGEYAFANCKGIKIARISANFQTIGEGAFSNCRIERVDLPDTVTKLALDAFDEDTIVTISGICAAEKLISDENKNADHEELSAINVFREKIKGLEEELLKKRSRIEEIADQIREKERLLGVAKEKRPLYERPVNDVNRRLNELETEHKQIVESFEEQLSAIREEIRQLEKELKDTFFLNRSKKNSLSQEIATKHQEESNLQTRLTEASNSWRGVKITLEKELTRAGEAQKAHINECQIIQRQIEDLNASNTALVREEKNLNIQLDEIRHALEKAEEDHRNNSEMREQKLEKIRKREAERAAKETEQAAIAERKRLKKQRDELLKTLNKRLKTALRLDIATPEKKHVNPDEELLNVSYEKLIEWENNRKISVRLAKYSTDNQKALDKLDELNRILGLENEGDLNYALEHRVATTEWVTDDFPERVEGLCQLFGKEELWSRIKKTVQGQKCRWSDSLHKQFFAKRNCALLVCEKDKELLFLPYCLIGYSPKSDMAQMFYDQVHVSIESSEFESEEIQDDCEEIGNRYLYTNRDGSRSMRYSYNPLIHQWRKSCIVIKSGSEKYSFPIARKAIAEELKDAIEAYVGLLNGPVLKEPYQAIKSFQSVEEIENLFKSSKKHLKKQADLEKERRIAERQKAEQEAEEKRRKLIAKQRERNTEKRFDEISASQTETSEEMLTWQPAHEEKKRENVDAGLKAYPAVAGAILDQTHAFGEQPQDGLILDSSVRTVHNNIFSLDFSFRGDAKSRAQGRSVFMCDAFGNVISDISTVQIENKKKLRLTMTLKQNSFSKKEKYYLAVVNDANGVVESITEFKIDIAFSNIFDDGFGF